MLCNRSMHGRWPAFLALACVASAALADGAALDSAKQQRIAASIASYMERTGAPAVSVYVDRGGAPLYASSIGVADLEHGTAVGPDSVFAIGSITKSYTAHAVLQLVASGRLSLDDTVGKLLPDYAGPGRDVTVTELLAHTSGLPNYVHEIPGLRSRLRRDEFDRKELVATFESLPLAFRPGERWSYTNAGYYLLGLIVERTSGKSYYDYLREDVLGPLGLDGVWSGDDSEIVPGRVHGYERGRTGLRNAPPVHYLVPYSAGSLLSTAEQVARYRRAVFTSPQVPVRVRQLVMTDAPLVAGMKTGYLLGGLVRTDFEGQTKYAHSGEIWGFAASHAYYPDSDTTIVVLTNVSTDLPTPVSLERQIARIVLDLPSPTVQGASAKPTALENYAGRYVLDRMRIGFPSLTFLAHEGALYVGFGDVSDPKRMLPLLPAGQDRFVAAPDPETAFVFDPPGREGPSGKVVMDAFNGRIPAVRAAGAPQTADAKRN